jgi:hypothetical protein
MANYSLGRIVPEKLVPIFESTNPYSSRDITNIMSNIFDDFSCWEYLHYVSEGLRIECKRKPTQTQLETLFTRVERLLKQYPVLDKSDEITYEEYTDTVKREMEKDNQWCYGDGYDYIKLHQKHNERAFAESFRKNSEVAE